MEVFDSFGKNPGAYSKNIEGWMGTDYIVYRENILQSDNSTFCRNYCLHFLLLQCHGFTFENLLSIFCADRAASNPFVCKFISKYFRKRTKIQDSSSIIKTNNRKMDEKMKYNSDMTSTVVPIIIYIKIISYLIIEVINVVPNLDKEKEIHIFTRANVVEKNE